MKTSSWKKLGKIMFVVTILALQSSIVLAGIKLKVAMANPYLEAEQKQRSFLKVSLTGEEIGKEKERTPINVALVLDRSGSMSGEKLRRAKEAALIALERLSSNDIISVIAYDDSVSVLVPATKVSDRSTLRETIRRLRSGGSTALFAGVSKGALEIRKFIDKNRVNRIILLSDGVANVGPSTPGELGDLGASLIKEGVSVTTIGLGLGYNEDLMTQLALRSDGNHAFVENPEELAKIFNLEFGDILSVVAQDVLIKIHCDDEIRPLRVLGRDAEISGQDVILSLNQVYSSQEKYVLLEVEVPRSKLDQVREVARVNISYANMETHDTDNLSGSASVRFTQSKQKIKESTDRDVMVSAVTQIATEANKEAVELRDKGNVEEAKKVLKTNASYLRQQALELSAPELDEIGDTNEEDAENLDDAQQWNSRRKSMRKKQFEAGVQQSY